MSSSARLMSISSEMTHSSSAVSTHPNSGSTCSHRAPSAGLSHVSRRVATCQVVAVLQRVKLSVVQRVKL